MDYGLRHCPDHVPQPQTKLIIVYDSQLRCQLTQPDTIRETPRVGIPLHCRESTLPVNTGRSTFAAGANMTRPREGGPGSATFGTFEDLGLAIIGLGVQYPALQLTPPDLRALAKRHYPDSPAYVAPRPCQTLLTKQYVQSHDD